MRGSTSAYSRSETKVPASVSDRGDEIERQDHREVARQDRLVAEPPEPRPGEDLLEDHRAADQPGNRNPNMVTNGRSALRSAWP